MLVVMRQDAAEAEVAAVIAAAEAMGFDARPVAGAEPSVILLAGSDRVGDGSRLAKLPGVHELVPAARGWRRAARGQKPSGTVVHLAGGVAVGGRTPVIMAGPCAVEDERQIVRAAIAVRAAGANVLRGGSFKPRSSPYSFQGLGTEGLKLLARARAESGLPVVTEAVDVESLGPVAEVADLVQIGARNMQNYSLLRAAGRVGRPVLLKRNPGATIEELLLAAEYLLAEGNPDVILCERGIRGFDGATRNLLDLGAIPMVHRLSHLPILADPSHGTGRRDLVAPMSLAALAAGADGLLVEVHPDPQRALSDGAQSLDGPGFASLMQELRSIAGALGRPLAETAGVPA
jgi:3-deoxy-7-phosphoheptulonate synthase